jgi:hypothetical protein
VGKPVRCGECKTALEGELNPSVYEHGRKGMTCSECKRSYCMKHYELGGWTRYAITMDDDVRTAMCPKGHTEMETGYGSMG